jgi:coronatine-insensitive protein 1
VCFQQVRNVIGDRGLEVVADTCKKLRRLRIEWGDDDLGQEEQGGVSQLGLTAVAVGCRELEYIAAYVSDITNGALESIGTFCKNLYDFRVVLLDRERDITDLPLDNGVRALLRNCTKLRRFALYLRPGGLSDVGLGYIGQYSGNIQYMLLGNVGESDNGLIHFAMGCTNLRKLELRSCCFSERALALAVLQMPSLRYIWVQGYRSSQTGQDLLLMARPFWNIEFVPHSPQSSYQLTADGLPCVDSQAQVLAYYSLAGRRSDCPQWLVPLHPA